MTAWSCRKAQAELRETVAAAEAARQHAVSDSAELRQVMNCLPQAIVLMDGANRILLWNENYERKCSLIWPISSSPGSAIEAILPQCHVESGHHDDEDGRRKQRRRHGSRTGWTRIDQAWHRIVEQNLSDGRWIRYDQHQTPDGKKVCVRTDVTDDRNAAESFRLLFENNPVPMWVVEKSTLKFIDVNAAALELYGYTREEFLKMTFAGYTSAERIPEGAG